MAISVTFRQQVGTPLTVKASAGDATMDVVSLANGSYRQSTKLDLGATFAERYSVQFDGEWAATPTAKNTITVWANPSSSATAGTDNRGGCAGTDSAYTGYSSNASDSVAQLQFVGSGQVTAQATPTVQKLDLGVWCPKARYNSFVLLDGAGSAFHSNSANCVLTLTPLPSVGEA